ncbi:MAG: CheR family methyltransferase [Bacteroidota bacterium]
MIPENLLHQTKNQIAHQLGWEFGHTRAKDFERGLCSMAHDLGIKETPESLTKWLQSIQWTNHELDIITKYLTVGETYFFREKAQLDIFKNRIIPELLAERAGKEQILRIWSAGCCSGEEPYTLAILLKEIVPDLHRWQIMILGTDINKSFLEKAKKGIYSAWSFRETSSAVQHQYFNKVGNHWEILQEIKEMVTFSPLNLAENTYPSPSGNTNNIDVLFCRNVLMYFTSGQIRTVSNRFYHSLNPRGWLIPSAVEINDDNFSDFAPVNHDLCTVYRKIPKQARSISEGMPQSSIRQKAADSNPTKPKSLISSSRLPIPAARKYQKPETVTIPSPKTVAELFSEGQYDLCIEMCLTIMETASGNTDILSLIVKSLANLGKLSEARLWGEKLLTVNGVDATHYYLIATILIEMNELIFAEDTLKRALYLNPHHILSQFLMGTVAMRLDKQQTGKKHFKNVMELLSPFRDSDIVPEADGLTAGRLREMVSVI